MEACPRGHRPRGRVHGFAAKWHGVGSKTRRLWTGKVGENFPGTLQKSFLSGGWGFQILCALFPPSLCVFCVPMQMQTCVYFIVLFIVAAEYSRLSTKCCGQAGRLCLH